MAFEVVYEQGYEMIFDIDKELLKALLVMADVIEARNPYIGEAGTAQVVQPNANMDK